MKEGRKEMIDMLMGSKVYFRIRARDKKFPLHVRFQALYGLYEIYVSKSIERPNKQNCDFSFNASNFEINYLTAKDIEYVHITVNGLGKLKAALTLNFTASPEEKILGLQKKHSNKKESGSTTKYEFFKEHMTCDEEKEFQEIIGKYLENNRMLIY